MLLVVVHGVQLLAELLLHGGQVAGGLHMYQHGSAHGVAGLVGVRAEGVQQHVALVVQGQGGLAALVRHGVGVHAHIARGGGLGALRRVAAVDRRARHGAGSCGGVEGQRRLRRHADAERFARLHLHGGGNGAVPEIVGNIHQVGGIGARLTGILHLLGIDPHDGQLVLVVELDSPKGAIFTIGIQIVIGRANIAVHQFPVQEYQRLGGTVRVLQQALAVQQVIGAGVGRQRHGGGIGVGVVELGQLAGVAGIDVVGVQHGHVDLDLRGGGGGQAVDGLSQLPQGRYQLIILTLSNIVKVDAASQIHSRRSGLTQRFNALGGIARQGIRIVLLHQILNGFHVQLNARQAVGIVTADTRIQRLAGRLQLRRHRLDAFVGGGLVVVGGVALCVEHGSHQSLRLVENRLIYCP